MPGQNFATPDELTAQAKTCLKGNWTLSVFTFPLALVMLLTILRLPLGKLIAFFVVGSVAMGLAMYYLSLAQNRTASFVILAKGFDKYFAGNFVLGASLIIRVIFWALLLIVPGVIKLFGYSMAFFIKSENPQITAREAILASEKMMAGHKKRLFLLCRSFFGWFLLSLLTAGLGFLWLLPYFATTLALFYLDLKEKSTE